MFTHALNHTIPNSVHTYTNSHDPELSPHVHLLTRLQTLSTRTQTDTNPNSI